MHVGLAIDGVAREGAVALPALDACFCTQFPPALAPEARPIRMLVSRTRPAAEAVVRLEPQDPPLAERAELRLQAEVGEQR